MYQSDYTTFPAPVEPLHIVFHTERRLLSSTHNTWLASMRTQSRFNYRYTVFIMTTGTVDDDFCLSRVRESSSPHFQRDTINRSMRWNAANWISERYCDYHRNGVFRNYDLMQWWAIFVNSFACDTSNRSISLWRPISLYLPVCVSSVHEWLDIDMWKILCTSQTSMVVRPHMWAYAKVVYSFHRHHLTQKQ